MVFHRKQKNVREINLSIDHNQIKQIPVFNFLGIIFDKNLSWKKHTKMIANKFSRVTGILCRLKSVFPKEVLVIIIIIIIIIWFKHKYLEKNISNQKCYTSLTFKSVT